MYLSKYERETHICYTEVDDMASVDTSIKADMRRYDKLCRKNPMCTVIKEDEWTKWYKVPIGCVLPRNLPMQTEGITGETGCCG
jgi:hypothetical protein